MSLLEVSVLLFVFLIGIFSLTAINSVFRKINKWDSQKLLNRVGKFFFYRYIHEFFLSKDLEELFFATICAQNIARFGFAITAAYALFYYGFLDQYGVGWVLLFVLALVLITFILGEYLPRIFGTQHPELALTLCAPVASVFMLVAFPFTYPFLKILHSFSRNIYLDALHEPDFQAKQQIIDIVQEADVTSKLDVHDRELFESVITFRERIAREVMVPRVNVFSLSADTSIKEAAKQLEGEGYSRIPVYRNSVDNIVGVLMSKDILEKYVEYEQQSNNKKILEAPIETIQKNILYTPETKKISQLLQEFRKKQVHLAIVVDEYGGTEGIVTIEDILEQIVGEIADEYDKEEEIYAPQPDGSWIVDARMNILDIEEQIGIKIDEEGDFDTIGGFIFHITETIPAKGFVIHRDEFEIEVLSSNERFVEKVRLKPIEKKEE